MSKHPHTMAPPLDPARQALAADAMVEVHTIARLFASRCGWSDTSELVAEASLAATEAARRYDPKMPVPFMSYAVRRVYGAMCNLVRREVRQRPTKHIDHVKDTFEAAERAVDPFDDTAAAARADLVARGRSLVDQAFVAILADVAETSAEHQLIALEEQARTKKALDECVAALAGPDRRLVELRVFEGLDQLEAAEALGVSRRTLQRRQDEVFARLRKALLERGVTVPIGFVEYPG